jgi:integration host factor subunit alpha
MENRTITRDDITHKLLKKTNLDLKASKKVVDQIFDLMAQGLALDGALKLANFGSFHAISKKERKGRNPRTQEEAVITPRKIVSFRFSKYVKDNVLDMDKKLEPIRIKANFSKDMYK